MLLSLHRQLQYTHQHVVHLCRLITWHCNASKQFSTGLGISLAEDDVQGLVFGVGTDKGVIKLFDVRSYAQGPFDAFTVSLFPCHFCKFESGRKLMTPVTMHLSIQTSTISLIRSGSCLWCAAVMICVEAMLSITSQHAACQAHFLTETRLFRFVAHVKQHVYCQWHEMQRHMYI